MIDRKPRQAAYRTSLTNLYDGDLEQALVLLADVPTVPRALSVRDYIVNAIARTNGQDNVAMKRLLDAKVELAFYMEDGRPHRLDTIRALLNAELIDRKAWRDDLAVRQERLDQLLDKG